jgi:hypothetical protein
MIGYFMPSCLDKDRETDALLPESSEQCIKRNPGAAIETTEITNTDGAKVAWSDVKNACEVEGLTITEVKKRAKELQKRETELTTTAGQWLKRGEAHRLLVFDKATGAIEKARMRPPKSWKEFDLADRAARRAAGLENADVVQQTLIHINEIDAEQPIEAELVTTVEAPQG